MENKLLIYNTLSRTKELFKPAHAPHVGMYVCGPTVYGDAHLGHARPAITFDILFRYLTHLGYKVRYVRNITDVGHLEHDADDGEDKIAKKARLEQLEPMEVVQYYLNRYHKAMEALNVLPPSIEPHASGHIIEQIQLVEEILKNGYAYESQGSVYFDVAKYNKDHHYGKLSGRNLDDVTILPASLTDSRRNVILRISPFGNVPSRNISCVGHRHGATVSRDGTVSVQPWVRNILAKHSISTVEVWILCSLTMNARLRRVWLRRDTIWCATGCTTICLLLMGRKWVSRMAISSPSTNCSQALILCLNSHIRL